MNVYRSIDRNKIQFDFLVNTTAECDYNTEIKELGGMIYYTPRYLGYNLLAYKKEIRRFFRKHPEHRIVHGHIGSSAPIYLNEAKKQGRYTIAHSHTTFNDYLSLEKIAFFLAASPVRYVADYFFACSLEAGNARFGKKITADPSRFAIVKNAIDLSQYSCSYEDHLEKKKNLNLNNKLVIGHVGRFEHPKNQKFLVDILAKLQEAKQNAVLVLIGDGSQRNSIEQMVFDYGLKEKVIFTGSITNVNEWLFAMDVFLFPSFYEGLPFAVIEAQAAGLPCIISSGISDLALVTDHVTKLSLAQGATHWAQTCVDISHFRKDAASRNIQQVADHGFNIDTVAQALQSFYLTHG